VQAQIDSNLAPPPQTVYQYIGKPFTTIVPPYTTNSFVSATISVPSPLPPNLVYKDISSLLPSHSSAFVNIGDGLQSLSASFTPAGLSTGLSTVLISTDANGRIVAPWLFNVSANTRYNQITTAVDPFLQPPFVGDGASFGGTGTCVSGFQACSSEPGTWSKQGPDAVPMFPANGSTVYQMFTISWAAAQNATWYRVWVSTTGSGENLLPCSFNGGMVDPGGCWTGDTTLTLSAPLAVGNYRWWVKSWSAQRDGKWSTATPFSVAKARFEDRGLTIYDTHTGLEWERKTTDGSVHDVNNVYSWSGSSSTNPNGTAFTSFLSTLNGTPCVSQSVDGIGVTANTCPGFAGHSDWRIPAIDELETIVDCSFGPPCINPIFEPAASDYYWSSSSQMGSSANAWAVNFTGPLTSQPASNSYRVRAVRGSMIPNGPACTRNVSGAVVVLPGCR
jgi:hypothetical protein